MDNAILNQCRNMIKLASPILGGFATDQDIRDVLDYIDEYKRENEYYYADLGSLMFGSDDAGCELMLKMGSGLDSAADVTGRVEMLASAGNYFSNSNFPHPKWA